MEFEHIVSESLEIQIEGYWVRAWYTITILSEVTVLAIHVAAKESWDVIRLCAIYMVTNSSTLSFSIGVCRRGFKSCRPVI